LPYCPHYKNSICYCNIVSAKAYYVKRVVEYNRPQNCGGIIDGFSACQIASGYVKLAGPGLYDTG